MDILYNFLRETFALWLEMSPYLLLGMVMAGVVHVLLGKEFISRQLGSGGFKSIIKATILGIPLPVCSCGVIPLASSLKKDGAHRSSVLSFLVSTPTTGIDSILATYSLLGPLFALFRPLGSFCAGIFLGTIDYIFGGRKETAQKIPAHDHVHFTARVRLKEFMRYAFVELPRDTGKWLVLGTVIGGAISSFIPQEVFSRYVSFPFDFIVALGVGVPLYVCATGSIPIAASLIMKGFSPGAALVFLIAGPATNAITLAFVRAKLGVRSFYLYLISITAVAFILGISFNFIWRSFKTNPDLVTGAGKMLPFEYKVVCGVILFGLILVTARKKKVCVVKADVTISVPDVHCTHCKVTLKEQLKKVKDVLAVSVDVKEKTIRIQGNPDYTDVIAKIKEAGYHPENKTDDPRPQTEDNTIS